MNGLNRFSRRRDYSETFGRSWGLTEPELKFDLPDEGRMVIFMMRKKFGGVKLLLIVAASLILVAQVSAAPVTTEMSDGAARDQIVKHEQYAAHYNNAIKTQESVQSAGVEAVNNAATGRYALQVAEQSGGNGDNAYLNPEAVSNAARERYAAQVAEQGQSDGDNQYQNSEALTIRERLHAINEKLSNGDLTDDEISDLRRLRYELELKLKELIGSTGDDTADSVNTDDVSEIAAIRERIRALNAMLEEGDLTDDEISELRRLRYELELKLNGRMGMTGDDTDDSVNTDDISKITSIRERIHAIDEMLDEGDLTDEEVAELRRLRYELELRLNGLMNEESNNNNSAGSQTQNGNSGDNNNRSDVVGSIRDIIRSFFGF